MQLVNGVQFLNFNFLLVLFTVAADSAVFGTVIVTLACMYTSLLSNKIDLINKVLNLTSLLALYVPRDSSFISNQSSLKSSLNSEVCSIQSKLFTGGFSTIAQPCESFTSQYSRYGGS